MERVTLVTKPTAQYELLDSGREEKLERFGDVILARPDPQCLWEKKRGDELWGEAAAEYVREGREGEWKVKKELPKEWQIEFGGLKFIIKPTSFKHTGLFPEQLSNWEWFSKCIEARVKEVGGSVSQRDGARGSEFSAENYATPDDLLSPKQITVLNLFGYTGGATLAAAKAGAAVTHVDASKTAVAWARENAKVSGLEDKPIRWIVEDVLVFVEREIKRGKKYDAIIMDPPAFGHGPNNELWKIEEDFLKLIELCNQLLSDKPLFFIINGYASGYSPLSFAYNLESIQKKFGGVLEYGDLAIEERGGQRLLPCGIFARWKNA